MSVSATTSIHSTSSSSSGPSSPASSSSAASRLQPQTQTQRDDHDPHQGSSSPATSASSPASGAATTASAAMTDASDSWEPEVIVIGAGVAGCALAHALSQPQAAPSSDSSAAISASGLSSAGSSGSASAGASASSIYAHSSPRNVLLLERDLSPPDRIVGELLQPGGVAALERLGMKSCLEGFDATPVEGYCVVMSSRTGEGAHVKQRVVDIPYPDEEDELRRQKRREAMETAVDVVAGGDIKSTRVHLLSSQTSGGNEKVADAAAAGPSFSRSGRKEGRSFHHGRFIDSLRRKVIAASKEQQQAAGSPHVRVMEATVKNLIACESSGRIIGVSASVKPQQQQSGDAGEEAVTRNFYAPLTVVADGCFSKFRSTTGSTVTVSAPASAATSAAESDGEEPAAPALAVVSSSQQSAAAGPSRSSTTSLRRRRVRHEPVAKVATRSHFVGLILDNVPLPRPHHGTVCLTPSGPVLLYQIADKANETRMLIDVKVPAGSKLPSVGDGSLKRHLEEHYLPHLPEAFLPSIQHALDTQRLRTMPNSFLPPKMQGRRGAREGVVMVGDSWNMRHPLTGGGMTVALSDAVLLAGYLRRDTELDDLHDWETIRHRLQEWHWRRKNLSGVVNVLSIALYDLFGADDEDLAVLREGCFKYFELGGDRVAGPVGLLSALTPKPLLLFYHFFSVALYSIYILFTSPKGAPTADSKSAGPRLKDYPALSVQSVRVFYTACVVLLPVIWSELKI